MRLKNKGTYKLESLITVVLSLENDFNYFEITDTMQLRHTTAGEIFNSTNQTNLIESKPQVNPEFTLRVYSGLLRVYWSRSRVNRK